MIRSYPWLSRAVLSTLVIAPIGVMGILTVTILLPNLKNPEAKVYSSSIGYPALQRLAGKPIKVQTVPVVSKTLESSVAAPGEAVPLQEVGIRPLVSGLVEKVEVVEGERVRRGQPLVRLQRISFEAQVEQARNEVGIAEAKLQALKVSSAAKLRKLEDDVKVAQAALDDAGTRLQQLDSIAQEEIKNIVEAAQFRLETAREKLEQIRPLVEKGAITRFQLYEAQDVYATRQRELLNAKQGSFDSAYKRFNNRGIYLENKAAVVSAQQALELAKETTEKQIENDRLTLDTKRIELQKAIRDLNATVIYASTDGLVSKVNIHSGELADGRSRDPIITLTQDIVFKAFVDQAQLNAVKVGDPATVRLIAYPGRTFQGRVTQINPTVETEAVRPGKVGTDRQYTYSVWVAVDDLKMPPGLQGYVQFNQGKTSLVIPESAVTHLSGGEGMVMVTEAGRAVVKKVNLGRIFDNQREVREGLKPGEQVVLSPRALNPGDRLEVQSTQGQHPGDQIDATTPKPLDQSSLTQENLNTLVKPQASSQTAATQLQDPFAEALTIAEKASASGKTAKSPAEWLDVATKWQQASDLMGKVPSSHNRYQIAQDRIVLYRRNSEASEQEAKKRRS